MARRVYQLTNTNNRLIVNDLGFQARSVAISNYSQFPIYVNVGSESTPSRVAFTDVVPPFASYVIDPAGLNTYSIFIDNSASPFTIFAYPVVIVFSTGSAAAQSSISFIPPSASGYVAKLQSVQLASMIDLWIYNDTTGAVAVDTINGSRSAAYVGSPTLANVLFQDNATNVESLNGSSQSMNNFTSSFAGVFNGIEGTLLIWAKLTSAQWSDANGYFLTYITNGAQNIQIRKSAANTIQCNYGSLPTFAVTPSSNWFAFVMTWSQSNTRLRFYINGTQSGVDTVVGSSAWNGTLPTIFQVGQQSGASFWPGSFAFLTLWNKELNATDVNTVSTIP